MSVFQYEMSYRDGRHIATSKEHDLVAAGETQVEAIERLNFVVRSHLMWPLLAISPAE